MNSQKVMRMKKIYKEKEGNKKLEEVYEESANVVTSSFSSITVLLDDILKIANTSLSTGKNVEVELNNKYMEFNNCLDKIEREMKLLKEAKHHTVTQYLDSYKKMYLSIVVQVLGKKAGKSERLSYVTFLVASEVVRYKKFIRAYIDEYYNELTSYYEEVDKVVAMLKKEEVVADDFSKIGRENDEEEHIGYIGNVKDLERMAKELGYVLKGCNGSHKKYQNPDTKQCVTIPYHGGKDIGYGLSKLIQKQLMDGCIA